MTLSRLLSIKGLVCFLFGVGFILVPAGMMSLYGVELDQIGSFMTKFFGVGMLGIGFICISIRRSAQNAIRGILLSLFLADSIGFAVALQLQLSGLVNAFAWSVVLIWLFFAVGIGYFRFIKTTETAMRSKEPNPL